MFLSNYINSSFLICTKLLLTLLMLTLNEMCSYVYFLIVNFYEVQIQRLVTVPAAYLPHEEMGSVSKFHRCFTSFGKFGLIIDTYAILLLPSCHFMALKSEEISFFGCVTVIKLNSSLSLLQNS